MLSVLIVIYQNCGFVLMLTEKKQTNILFIVQFPMFSALGGSKHLGKSEKDILYCKFSIIYLV